MTLDAHKAVECLIKKGFKKEHAEEIVNLVQEGKDIFLALENQLIYYTIVSTLILIATLGPNVAAFLLF